MRSIKLSVLVLIGSIIGGMLAQPAAGYIRGALAQALTGCALAVTCSFTGTDTTIQFQVGFLGGAANFLQALGSLTTQPTTLVATGSDTNISAGITTKGNGCFVAGSGSNGPLFNACATYAVNNDGALQGLPSPSGSGLLPSQVGNSHYGIQLLGGTNNRTQPMVNMTPTSSSQSCQVNDMAWDTGFVYVCTATNTWKRATLATF